MPEAPELEVVREFLDARAVGERVERAEVVRPSVLRSLSGEMAADAVGTRVCGGGAGAASSSRCGCPAIGRWWSTPC